MFNLKPGGFVAKHSWESDMSSSFKFFKKHAMKGLSLIPLPPPMGSIKRAQGIFRQLLRQKSQHYSCP